MLASLINSSTVASRSEYAFTVLEIVASFTRPHNPSEHNKNLSPILALTGFGATSTSTSMAIPKALVNSFFLG